MKVVIIGAGIIGVAVAEALAVRGVQVTVLDMRSPGRGASQAAAGILAPYVEGSESPELFELGKRSLAMFDDFIPRVAAAAAVTIEYARHGSLEIALDPAGTDRLRGAARTRGAAGASIEWLDQSALRSFDPSVTHQAQAGLLTRDHGHVGATALVSALVQSARSSGAVFEFPVEVSAVHSNSIGATVKADDRAYRADAVIIASGSWARRVRVANVAAVPLRPIRGQLLHLHWTSTSVPQPSRVLWGPRCYAVPWADGSLLVGATAEDVGFDERSTVAGVSSLAAAIAELTPAASAATLEAVRVGLRPALPDELPAIGPLPHAPHVIAAIGHYRSGILLAPLTAELVCQHLLDGNSHDPAFASVSTARLFGGIGARLET